MTASRRHLAACLAALAGTILVLAGLLYWQASRQATASADEHLDTVRLTQRLVEGQDARDLATRAEIIADNQAVTGYVAEALGGSLPGLTVDTASIADLLEERRSQLELAAAAVIDDEGNVVAGAKLFSNQGSFDAEPLFIAAKKSQALQTGLWIDGTRLLHVAIRPLVAYGSGNAYLLIGMPVNQGFAQTIADIGATDVALVATSSDGPLTLASTLQPNEQLALQSQMAAMSGSAEKRFVIDYDGSHYDGSVAPLFGSSKASLVALITPRRDIASLLGLGLPMLIGGLLALLAVAVVSYRSWVRVYRPAGDLLTVMEQAANTGDLHMKAPERGAPVIADLAATLNRLLAGLDKSFGEK